MPILDHQLLVGETDARAYADTFAATFPHAGTAGVDIETLTAWFATAIEAGRDAGTRALATQVRDALPSAEDDEQTIRIGVTLAQEAVADL